MFKPIVNCLHFGVRSAPQCFQWKTVGGATATCNDLYFENNKRKSFMVENKVVNGLAGTFCTRYSEARGNDEKVEIGRKRVTVEMDDTENYCQPGVWQLL